MYIPDWSIVQQVKAYDDRLSIKWREDVEKWGVYRSVPSANNLYDKDVLVMNIQNQDGSYRCLDSRVLERLKASDTQRLNQWNYLDRMRELEEHNEKVEEQNMKDATTEIEDITRDIAPTVRREMSDDIGSRNVPKEDVQQDLVSSYGEGVL